jgi:hypothetical protein
MTSEFRDGSSADNAGASAAAIKAMTGTIFDGMYWINLPTMGPTHMYCIMSQSTPEYAYASAAAILKAFPTAANGDYWIIPTGQALIKCYVNFTYTAVVGKGWVLVQRGRESLDYWQANGQNTVTGLTKANMHVNTPVANAPSAWVNTLIGGWKWENTLTGGWKGMHLLLNRSMSNDSYVYKGTTEGTFAWSLFNVQKAGGRADFTHYNAMWGIGAIKASSANLENWQDSVLRQGSVPGWENVRDNDINRSFSWAWANHQGYQGWSHGNTGLPTDGFQAGAEGHPITLANVYVLC